MRAKVLATFFNLATPTAHQDRMIPSLRFHFTWAKGATEGTPLLFTRNSI